MSETYTADPAAPAQAPAINEADKGFDAQGDLTDNKPSSEDVANANAGQTDSTKAASDAPPIVALSDDETTEATKRGMLDAIAENAKRQYATSPAGVTADPDAPLGHRERFPFRSRSIGLETMLDLSVEELNKRLDPKADNALEESQIAALMELERSGRNRTPYVQALMKRLDVENPYEVSDAGPPFTHDVTTTLFN